MCWTSYPLHFSTLYFANLSSKKCAINDFWIELWILFVLNCNFSCQTLMKVLLFDWAHFNLIDLLQSWMDKDSIRWERFINKENTMHTMLLYFLVAKTWPHKSKQYKYRFVFLDAWMKTMLYLDDWLETRVILWLALIIRRGWMSTKWSSINGMSRPL